MMNKLPEEPSKKLNRTHSNNSKSENFRLSDQEFLAGGGEMGGRMRATDWSKTSLGPVEQWSQSLKTAVRITLTSRQPMFVWWGKELINLYNDPYKAIVGGKHPEALGQPASVVWQEIWDQVGPRAQSAMENNEGTYDEALPLIMERNGYPEETYYTFSYSPIPGDNGGSGGIICANTDDTQRIIGERQLKLLRELAAGTTNARTIEEACELSATYLKHDPYDLPFAMIYLVDQATQTVHLTGACGIEIGHPAVPQTAKLTPEGLWPFNEVIKENRSCLISDLDASFGTLPSGAWKRSPQQAIALPLPRSGQTGKSGILIVGLNPFRLFDEGYAGFINLVVGQIAATLTNAQAYEEERKRAEALAEVDRAKTTFFSNVSHEFRTPLTLMLGPIEDMLNETTATLAPQQRTQLETLQRNSLRLLKLVNTLLDFSRIEAGRVQAIYQPTDLATYTIDLASTFRSAIEKAGMQLIVDCAPLDEPVYVDRDMWEKIVLNLLSNAFKYTLAGKITVKLQPGKETVELSVQDTGTGIPENEISHIFERFHRIQGSQGRTYEGTGIGLSLVQELVMLHGGSIKVESVVGVGSTFSVTIPLGTQHLAKERISAKSGAASSTALGANPYVEEALRWLPDHSELSGIIQDIPAVSVDTLLRENLIAPNPSTPKAKILLADDNADMREYVSKLLAQHYSVTAVANGKLALQLALQEPPDLVLSDIMMPELDGFALLKELRANPLTVTIPIIMLSARAGEEAQVEGIEAGANDYLIKPFSARELLARIGANLEMARIRRDAQEKIRQAQQHLTAVINNSPLVFWSLDKQGIYTLSEGKGLEALGLKPGELVGKSQYEIYKDLPELVEPVDRALNGESFSTTLEFQGHFYDTYYSPLRDEKGEITGMVAVSTDVTAQMVARQKVEESEEKYRTLFETMEQGFCIIEVLFDEQNKPVDYRFLETNPAFEGQTGFKEAIGKTVREFVPNLENYWFEFFGGVALSGESAHITQVVEEMVTWFDVYAYRLGATGSRKVAVLFTDITERKQTEQLVSDERQRLYQLFLQAPAGIGVVKGPNHVWEIANRRMLELIGREAAADVLGKPMFEAIPEGRNQGFEQIFDKVYKTGERFLVNESPVELIRYGKLEKFYVKVLYEPLREPDGRVSGIMILSDDITETVLARRKIEESEERFRTLADNISQLAWMTDEHGWIYWYNQRWYDYTGTTFEEMEGWGWQKVHHPDHVNRVVDKISQHFQTGEDWEDTFPLLGKDGAYRWFLSRAIPIRDENGKLLRWFGTNTDITERLQLEQRRDEFIGIASHELKTPVTSLKAYGQVLQAIFKRSGDLKAVQQLGKMDVQINKLTGLIGDLLDVTKIQEGKLQFQAEDFDFNELVNEIVEELERTTDQHTIVKQLGPTKTVYGDRERIGQVLTNLLTNAIKYSPQADKILVQTTSDNLQITFSVQDFGIGIAQDKQAHIFERFYRVTEENQETYPGLGLGLYISSEIIARQNGRIWLESTVGKGSTFSFSLPTQQPSKIL